MKNTARQRSCEATLLPLVFKGFFYSTAKVASVSFCNTRIMGSYPQLLVLAVFFYSAMSKTTAFSFINFLIVIPPQVGYLMFT